MQTDYSGTDYILRRWLVGTSCRVPAKPKILWENEDYILLKHHSHAAYVDRINGVKPCESFASLFEKKSLIGYNNEQKLMYNTIPAIRTWYGRTSKKTIVAAAECAEEHKRQTEYPLGYMQGKGAA